MNFFRAFFVCLFLFSGRATSVMAQEEATGMPTDNVTINDSDWQDTIDHVTKETNSLMTENEK